MRILHVSDFHARKAWFTWLQEHGNEYDAVCFTGDFIDLFGIEPLGAQVAWISSWMGGFPKPLLWCPGNHDVDTGKRPVSSGRWLESLPGYGLFNGGGRLIRNGVNFVRVGWKGPMPELTTGDIVLAHAPPAACKTAVSATSNFDNGDFDLGETLRSASASPSIVLSGHVHDPARWGDRCGKTWSFNPGVDLHASVPNHIIIDTLQRKTFWMRNGALVDVIAI